MADDEDIAALVVDNGSGMCKGEQTLIYIDIAERVNDDYPRRRSYGDDEYISSMKMVPRANGISKLGIVQSLIFSGVYFQCAHLFSGSIVSGLKHYLNSSPLVFELFFRLSQPLDLLLSRYILLTNSRICWR